MMSQPVTDTAAPALWEKVQHKQWEARCMEVYAAQIDRMDQGVGHIVDALAQTNSLDDTLTVSFCA